MKTAVIVPVYNEGSSLADVIGELRRHCPDMHVLVVDDASCDESGRIAESLADAVLHLPVNLGIGGAVQAGMRYAVARDYEWAVQFDGDGQHVASFVPSLVQAAGDGNVDLLIGSRFLGAKRCYKAPVARRLGMIVFSWLLRILTGQTVTDTTSGFRVYSRRMMTYFQNEYPVDFPDMPAILAAYRHGYSVKEVPVEMRQRQHGTSSTTLVKSMWYPLKTAAAAVAVYIRR